MMNMVSSNTSAAPATDLGHARRLSPPVDKVLMTNRLRYGTIRTLDVVVCAFALLFFAPLLAIIAIVVYLSDPGPILFAHRRLGRDGNHFYCLKFRSMVTDAEARLRRILDANPEMRLEWERDHKLRVDPRITRIGRFLRSSSLDELPQLWNVIRGDMSIVGPRPIVDAEVTRYGRYFNDYCRVRPGITGLWQISGRNDVSYRRRVALDVAFSRSISVRLYLRILCLTVPSVLLARGSY